MKKDKALEELFLSQRPQFDDKDAFMDSLTKRLDAVEYIKQYQEATIRRYKMVVVITFIAGIICGGVAMAYILSAPMDVPVFTIKSQYAILQLLSENSRFITVAAISVLMTFGITMMITNVLEVLGMRNSLQRQTIDL